MSGRFPGRPVYVPETMPIAEIMRNMEKRGRLKLTIKGQTEEALSANINQKGPASTAKDLHPGDEFDGSIVTLSVNDIQPYDRNPRTSANPKYAEIKASIRERGGLKGQLTVTKRPGSRDYMLYMGGNTRLQIIKELYAESKDARFSQVNCVFHAWKSEADVLASHLIENEARGDTLFIEKARGLIDLVREIELETGKPLSSRDIQATTAKMGMSVSQSTVLVYDFAVSHLRPIGQWLTRENATFIKRRYAQHEAIAEASLLAGEFVTKYPSAMVSYQTEFALQLEAKQVALRATADQPAVALRGETLSEFLRGLDRQLLAILGLHDATARRVFTALDAAGNEPLSAEHLRALINGDSCISTAPPASASTSSGTAPTRASGGTARTKVRQPTPAGALGRRGGSKLSSPPTPALRETKGLLPASSEASRQALPAPIAPHEILSAERFSEIGLWFFSRLNEWCGLTRIEQWLQSDDTLNLPHLFWLELPDEIAQRGDRDVRLEDVPDPDIGTLDADMAKARSASYRLVALLSGQLGGVIEGDDGRWTDEGTFAERLPPESPWRAAALVDHMSIEAFYNVWESQLGGVTAQRTCQLGLAPHDLLSVLQEPMYAERWAQLTVAYGQWRQALELWRKQGDATPRNDDLTA